MIRIGLIGKSETASSLAEDINYRIKGVELLAWSTTDRAMQRKAKDMGLKNVFSDPYDLTEIHQLDLIVLADEPIDRPEVVKEALASDVDLFMEFPIALNLQDAEEVAGLIKGHPSQKVMIAYPITADYRYGQVKNLVEEGKLGSIRGIELSRIIKSAENLTSDEISLRLIEDFYSMIHVSGKRVDRLHCRAISGSQSTDKLEDISGLMITGSFKDGGLFTVNMHASEIDAESKFTILGSEGKVSITDESDRAVRFHSKEQSTDIRKPEDKSYRTMLERFITIIELGERPVNNLEDSVHAVACTVKALKSLVFSSEESI